MTKPTVSEARFTARHLVQRARLNLHNAAVYLQAALYLEGCPEPDQAHRAVIAAIKALEDYPQPNPNPNEVTH